MNTQNAFTRGTTLIQTIIQKMNGLNIRRRSVIIEVLMLFLSFRGRINFLQLGRQGNLSERSYRNHFEKEFDWMTFNTQVIDSIKSSEVCIAFDPSYISKSGKKTPGLGYYYSGVAGKYKRGLEIGNIAVIDRIQNTAYHLESVMTPVIVEDEKDGDESKTLVDHYAQVLIDRKEELLKTSSILVVDGYFAKRKFIDAINNQTKMEVICRLRDDANLKYLYKGTKQQGRGRPKIYDGKVNVKKIDKRRAKLTQCTEQYRIYELEVYSVGLKRNIQLCYVEFLKEKGEVNVIKLFFSTNIQRPATEILSYYRARFQMEFLFRDAKQFTGLQHCQARSENKLNFHFNASLTSLNIAKCILRKDASRTERMSYSISDLKIRFQNRNIIYRIFSMYGIDRKLIKNIRKAQEVISFGAIAA